MHMRVVREQGSRYNSGALSIVIMKNPDSRRDPTRECRVKETWRHSTKATLLVVPEVANQPMLPLVSG